MFNEAGFSSDDGGDDVVPPNVTRAPPPSAAERRRSAAVSATATAAGRRDEATALDAGRSRKLNRSEASLDGRAAVAADASSELTTTGGLQPLPNALPRRRSGTVPAPTVRVASAAAAATPAAAAVAAPAQAGSAAGHRRRPAPATSFHTPGDAGFTPVARALGGSGGSGGGGGGGGGAGAMAAGGGSAGLADELGSSWSTRVCHCLRCDIIRLGDVVVASRALLAEAYALVASANAVASPVAGGGAAGAKGSRRERGPMRATAAAAAAAAAPAAVVATASPAESPMAVPPPAAFDPLGALAVSGGVIEEVDNAPPSIVLIDLDNFGFPQFKTAAPPSLLRLLAGGRVVVWCLYGVNFRRFFGVDAAEYAARIPGRGGAKMLARAVEASRRDRGAWLAPPPRNNQEPRECHQLGRRSRRPAPSCGRSKGPFAGRRQRGRGRTAVARPRRYRAMACALRISTRRIPQSVARRRPPAVGPAR